MKNILLLASHAVAEYDDVRMFTDLGYDIFAPGGYEVPSKSGEGIRPPLPNAPHHPELVARCEEVRAEKGEPGYAIDWAKAALHDDLIDWADAIIVHHFPERWIGGQWDRIREKRVIWRTCGQSDPDLERYMSTYRAQGMGIVRYSPKEREGLGETFAGQDVVIRFGKYVGDYGPWQGGDAIGNVTQHMAQRGDACGHTFWQETTQHLPVRPAGPGSEVMRGGVGSVPYSEMRHYLATLAAYLYTGTRPASYTLGLMEALLSGVPVVSIDPDTFGLPLLFEGHELALASGDCHKARRYLLEIMEDPALASDWSETQMGKARDLFDVRKVGAQWRDYLG